VTPIVSGDLQTVRHLVIDGWTNGPLEA